MTPERNIFKFGQFVFDLDARQLTRAGSKVHLSPKAFELLSMLLTNRPRALSKADLQARLWPETFVSETNLPGLVKEIRRALNDDARRAAVLRTVHGYGYAFAPEAEVQTSNVNHGIDATFWIVGDRQIRLPQGEAILGRDPEATVWFDYPGVSRRHARITVSSDGAVVEDLGSTNGTSVRGENISRPTALHDGDEVQLGPLRLTFRIRRTAASTEIYRSG